MEEKGEETEEEGDGRVTGLYDNYYVEEEELEFINHFQAGKNLSHLMMQLSLLLSFGLHFCLIYSGVDKRGQILEKINMPARPFG